MLTILHLYGMGIERMLFSLRITSHNQKSSPTRADREALRIAYGNAFVQGGVLSVTR